MDFRKRYVAYLNRLQAIARKHDELTDTDVRERLHEVINYFFIWGKPLTGFPKRFAMMSDGADRAVAEATRAFVADARKLVSAARVAAGVARHALIEDDAAKSSDGSLYDVYLGSIDKVAPARKPSADSVHAPVKAAARGEKPRYDPKVLAIKVRGKIIVPTFDPDGGMYRYEGRNCSPSYAQFFYEAKYMRAIALADLTGDEEESDRLQAVVMRKYQAAKRVKNAKRKLARAKSAKRKAAR